MLARACVFVMMMAPAFAQEAAPRFEVATVKASQPGAAARTPDGPLTFSAPSADLSVLMQLAYDVRMDQVEGVPRELAGQRWDVVAKTPAGRLRVDMKRLAAVAETALRHWIPPDAGRDALPVVDQTGLAGEYDVRLPMGPSHEDWVAILEDRTGLKLERRKMPVEVLVIDRAGKPAEN